ncbi:hypothetical protein KI688_005755 [Linnemannia hyalina]|uniref:Kelch repeat protein n=1 Tax=Linnemannia hyalina TaxID=64524 RepID=A0A9P8BXP2_9FUNG|nr:hypothetical protein KI688_005755 [Linnemannia hyalina]
MRTSLILLATIVNLLAFASAQAPTVLCCMAYTTVDKTTLYIQGGTAQRGSNYNNQFYSLDLTISGWNASSPPWKVLPVGAGNYSAPFTYYHAMTATKDSKKLIVWSTFTGLSTYDYVTSVWTNNTLGHLNPDVFGGQMSLALDPTTGLIYVPGRVNMGAGMLVYDPVTANTDVVPMYPVTMLSFLNMGNSFVWSELRKSFLYFGGFNQVEDSTVFNQYMFEYQPSTYNWTLIPTEGVQGQLASHCMVPAYDGTKMVVFGGWKPVIGGSDPVLIYSRVDTKDQYVSTLIYNLKSNQWVDQYVFTAVDSNNKLGIFIGVGVAAAVCIGAELECFLSRPARRKGGDAVVARRAIA